MTTESLPAPSRRHAIDPVVVLAVLLAMLAVIAINNRIFTYVSGQDPTTYVQAARDILHGGWSAICPSGGGVTAPGYPLLLAAAIALFGPMAPYWVNVSLALLLMPVTLLLLIRLGLAPRTAAVALFSSVLILAAGYPMNAAFLLYPFRELPALFFTVLGSLLFLTGCDAGDRTRRRAAFCAAAGVCALLTVAIREPSVLGFAGVLVWCLISRSPRMNKAISLGSFAAPLLLAVLAWFLFAKGSVPNRQWTYFMAQLSTSSLHTFADRFNDIEPQMRAWAFDELGWFWTAMSVVGIWALRRQPRALLAFLVPFVLLYVFYAFTEAHHRYFLSSMVFVAPLAGSGLAWIVDTAATRLPTVRPVLLALLPAAVLLGMASALVPVAMDLQPTGPRVKSPQIERFRKTIEQALPDKSRILLSPYCRYAADAIQSFTDLRPHDPLSVGPRRLADTSFAVLIPLNEQARFRGRYTPYSGPDASDIVGYFADLAPVCDLSGTPLSITLGHGIYGILRSQPWSTNRADSIARLSVDTNRAHVVWLDFRNADPTAPKTVSMANPADGRDLFVATITGKGLQPILVPPGVCAGLVPLRVASPGPIPRNIPLTIQSGDRSARFLLDQERSLSVHKWFRMPFRATSFGDKYAAILTHEGGGIEIPMPATGSGLNVEVSFQISTAARNWQPAVFQFLRNKEVAGEMRLAPDSGHWHGVSLRNLRAGEPLRLDIRSVTTDSGTVWRIHRLDIAIQPADTP